MTVPKKQSTAAKKARAVQRAAGGKHTALLAEQAVCGEQLDPFGILPETCARAPHPDDEPCSKNRDFDAAGWRERVKAEWAAEEARRAALTDDQRAEEARLAFEEEYDDGYTATDAWEDARSYKWED
ncbi:hypothetical protein OIA45_49000 (plasmid) [Streptomyces chartreusis]|uniref:hypothetical protein n=1 Tax=Streptomyces chartreusis TaxID=1969 RepID=UPI0037DD0834|nr:hypothetical protein OIA45_49000 [Streptomyces chartreusis]